MFALEIKNLELIAKGFHQVSDECLIVVFPRIGVNGHEIIVNEIVASQSNHVSSFFEELLGFFFPDFGFDQFLRPSKELNLFVQTKPLNLQVNSI